VSRSPEVTVVAFGTPPVVIGPRAVVVAAPEPLSSASTANSVTIASTRAHMAKIEKARPALRPSRLPRSIRLSIRTRRSSGRCTVSSDPS